VRVVVREWERVLVYKDGRFTGQLEAGRHRLRRHRRELVRMDLRSRLVPVPGQELLTVDAMSVKISLVARLRVADVRVAHESVQDSFSEAYTALQVALRGEVAARTLEQLMAAREELGDRVAAASAAAITAVGLVVDGVAVRDVMVAAELRQAALRVVTARQEGLASLERARGETAALRALANAAKLAQDNPALLALRTLRAVETGGATVVLRQDG
jgi:regulator of protease activity HflC (stomatin/prohibitin superfamily)